MADFYFSYILRNATLYIKWAKIFYVAQELYLELLIGQPLDAAPVRLKDTLSFCASVYFNDEFQWNVFIASLD